MKLTVTLTTNNHNKFANPERMLMLKIMNVLDDVRGLRTAYKLNTGIIKFGNCANVSDTRANQILVLK